MKSKYNNKKIVTMDGVFDSKKEHERWCHLKALQINGDISDLQRQVKFELIPKQEWKEPVKSRKGNRMFKKASSVDYVADFVYIEKGKLVVEDVKGFITQVYEIKKKLMLLNYNIQIKEV